MKQENFDFIKYISDFIMYRFNFVNQDIADFIACQAALESAYGHSVVYRENRNTFGMKLPKKRLTTAVGEFHGFAKYPTVFASICDYFFRLQTFGYNQSHLSCSLHSFIDNYNWHAYCPDDDYLSKINSIYKSFKS